MKNFTEIKNNILNFWFADSEDDNKIAEQQAKLWWAKQQDVDQAIRQKYQTILENEALGYYQGYFQPKAVLARIILLDQFSRNMYRDTEQAFQYDAQAIKLSKDLIAREQDQALRLIERVFVYLPLEHSENIEDQNLCVAKYQQLVEQADKEYKKTYSDFLDFAKKHHVIIERFGRFPHRNKILDRQSTAEELKFLTQPGSSF